MDEEVDDLYAGVVEVYDGLGDCVVLSFLPQDATVKINSQIGIEKVFFIIKLFH